MAQDTTIGHGAPGIAMRATQSYGGPSEPRFGEGVPDTTTEQVTAPAGGLNLPIYSVVAVDEAGVMTLAAYDADGTPDEKPRGILAHPVVMAAGTTMSVALYRAGHWDLDQMNWAASFDTEAKKKKAFEGSNSPRILLSKKKFNNDQIAV